MKNASYREVDWTEVRDSWDADTSDSWSEIIDEAEEEDEAQQQEHQENAHKDNEDEDVSKRNQRRNSTIVLEPPEQIVIPAASSEDSKRRNDRDSAAALVLLQTRKTEAEDDGVVVDDDDDLDHSSFSEGHTASFDDGSTFRDSSSLLRFSRSLYESFDRRMNRRRGSNNNIDQHRPERHRRPSLIDSAPTRFFSYALLLWIFELVLVLTLKRAGVIEPEFQLNQAVAQRVLQSGMTGWNDTSIVPLAALVHSFRMWGNESMIQASLTYLTQETKRPGFHLAQQGAQVEYPVLLVPGFVTSGLEVWGGKECARKHFRQRLWAAMVGARSFLTDRDCWRQHMMLDPLTGGDPEDIRLRASSGFEAVDYFIGNYWVFGKLIENLADVGYTPGRFMAVAPYDWRLAFPMLEKRDGYFTRVKNQIEAMHQTTGKKVVITSHSMGVLVVQYFFAWVTAPKSKGGGGGGAYWVDAHVHAFVNIAGSHLGVPKAITSLLSGEMSDTVLMNPMATAVEQFFGRKLRRELWRTWGSLWALLPKGGDAIWSEGADMCNTTTTTTSQQNESNDPHCPSAGMAEFLHLTDSNETVDKIVGSQHTALLSRRRNNMILHHHHKQQQHAAAAHVQDESGISPQLQNFMARHDYSLTSVVDYLKDHGSGFGSSLANAAMYTHSAPSSKPTTHRKHESSAWHDPTQTPLPHAPRMKLYCLYGVSRPTERAYYYKLARREDDDKNQTSLLDPPLVLDPDVSDPETNVEKGVKYSDGDGSVPLLSLGYLCADAYTRDSSGLNPSRTTVYTREYQHQAEFTVDDPMRSGPKSGDHVDILGNFRVLDDVLRILTDFEVEKVNENQISSSILQIAERTNRKGGIFKQGRKWRP